MMSIAQLREYTLWSYAIFDLVLSFVGMALLARPLSWMFARIGVHVPRRNWIILTLPIGILAHIAVGRYTPMTRQFLDLNGYWILKIVIIACTIAGLRGIKLRR